MLQDGGDDEPSEESLSPPRVIEPQPMAPQAQASFRQKKVPVTRRLSVDIGSNGTGTPGDVSTNLKSRGDSPPRLKEMLNEPSAQKGDILIEG